MKILLLLIASYLLGSVPFGYIVVKLVKKIDIRQHGSGNIGATNVVRVCGKVLGYPVFLLDFFKGFLPVVVAAKLFGSAGISSVVFNITLMLAAVAAVAGHNWTCFLNFKGGKGVATTVGALIALSISLSFLRIPLIVAVFTWVLLFFIFRVVSLGSVSAGAVFALFCVFSVDVPIEFKILASFLAVFIVVRHKNNYPEIVDTIKNGRKK